MTNPSDITVIYHNRRNFYQGRPIYWYEFMSKNEEDFADLIPEKFLNVPFTVYWEFGDSHEEAIKELKDAGITDIVEGDII